MFFIPFIFILCQSFVWWMILFIIIIDFFLLISNRDLKNRKVLGNTIYGNNKFFNKCYLKQ